MIDKRKLVRILGMFGSSNDAEVLAAARHAHRMVTQAGTDWPTLLAPPTNGAAPPPPPPPFDPWTDLKARDAILYEWIVNNCDHHPVARRLWSGMGQGLRVTEQGLSIGRFAMQISRGR